MHQGVRVTLGAFEGNGGVGRLRTGCRPSSIDTILARGRQQESPAQERRQYAGLRQRRQCRSQPAFLFGNQGVVIQQWSDVLKRPGVEAAIIIVAAALLAGGCFYFARLIENDSAHQTDGALQEKL